MDGCLIFARKPEWMVAHLFAHVFLLEKLFEKLFFCKKQFFAHFFSVFYMSKNLCGEKHHFN